MNAQYGTILDIKMDVRLLADLQIKSNLHETLFCLEMHWKPKGT